MAPAPACAEFALDGVREIEPGAAEMLQANPEMLRLVTSAVLELKRGFEDGEIDVEYSIDHGEGPSDERVYVAVYTDRTDRLELLDHIEEKWIEHNPLSHAVPVSLTVHGI